MGPNWSKDRSNKNNTSQPSLTLSGHYNSDILKNHFIFSIKKNITILSQSVSLTDCDTNVLRNLTNTLDQLKNRKKTKIVF